MLDLSCNVQISPSQQYVKMPQLKKLQSTRAIPAA